MSVLAIDNTDKIKIAGLLLPLAARLFNDGTEAAVDRLLMLVLAMVIAYAFGTAFARETNRPIGPGIVPFVLMFVVLLPGPVSLVAVGFAVGFGSIFGREVFGGKPVLPPALIASAFALFSYPDAGFELRNIGDLAPDPIFAIACLAGGAIYLWNNMLAWQVVAGAVAGSIVSSSLTIAPLDWEQPLLGTYLAGVLFMAASTEIAPRSKAARWMHGILFGVLVVIIRMADPDQPDGVVFAALLACLFAPLLDRLFQWRPQRG
jgi:Na+-transporting NADH:ubiquinone oxidoreductase subunit B